MKLKLALFAGLVVVLISAWFMFTLDSGAPFTLEGEVRVERWSILNPGDVKPEITGSLTIWERGPGWMCEGIIDGQPVEGQGMYESWGQTIVFSLSSKDAENAVIVRLKRDGDLLVGGWTSLPLDWKRLKEESQSPPSGLEIWIPRTPIQ